MKESVLGGMQHDRCQIYEFRSTNKLVLILNVGKKNMVLRLLFYLLVLDARNNSPVEVSYKCLFADISVLFISELSNIRKM